MQIEESVNQLISSCQDGYQHGNEKILCNLLKMTKQAHDQHESTTKDVENKLNEAKKCLKQMEIDSYSFPLHLKQDIMNSVREINKELSLVTADMEDILSNREQDLLSEIDRPSDIQISEAIVFQERRLVDQTEKLIVVKKKQPHGLKIIIPREDMNDQDHKGQLGLIQSLGDEELIKSRLKLQNQQKRIFIFSVITLVIILLLFITYQFTN